MAMQWGNSTSGVNVHGAIAVLGANEPNCDAHCSFSSVQTGANRPIPELVAGMRALERMRIPIGSPAPVKSGCQGWQPAAPRLAPR